MIDKLVPHFERRLRRRHDLLRTGGRGEPVGGIGGERRRSPRL